jgi:hypothetical protein
VNRKKRIAGLLVAAAATVALAIPALALAGYPGQTVKVKTTITINPYGSAGQVTAANENCVEGRQVVVKQVGIGKIGSAEVTATGRWTAEPKYKGPLPYKVYAEVKPVSEGTAGTIFKCLAATSKIRTIAGG